VAAADSADNAPGPDIWARHEPGKDFATHTVSEAVPIGTGRPTASFDAGGAMQEEWTWLKTRR
jgi:hypothetical protein